MREYDGLFIIDPAKEASLTAIMNDIISAIKKQNGLVIKDEKWGKQRLAFPIKKNAEGIYYKVNFSVDPSQITPLNNIYKLHPDIVRVMITVKDEVKNAG